MKYTYKPMKMKQKDCSETLTFKLQTPVNHLEESIRHSEHGEEFEIKKNTNTFPTFRDVEALNHKHVL
jgi:hypothetical protein